MVERKIRNELGEKVPVEIIFARAHSKDYQVIKRALLTEEAEKYTREETEKPETPAFDAKRLAGEVAAILLPQIEKKLPAPIKNVVERFIPRQEKNNNPSPSEQGIMGGLGILIMTEVYKQWRRRKRKVTAE